jgi:hypothetical protein
MMGCRASRVVSGPGSHEGGTRTLFEYVQNTDVAVVLFPTHLTHVLQPVGLVWVRRFKSVLSARFGQMSRDPRLLANAFAELMENVVTAAEKHGTRVGIVYSILEANQVATIGSVTGPGFL